MEKDRIEILTLGETIMKNNKRKLREMRSRFMLDQLNEQIKFKGTGVGEEETGVGSGDLDLSKIDPATLDTIQSYDFENFMKPNVHSLPNDLAFMWNKYQKSHDNVGSISDEEYIRSMQRAKDQSSVESDENLEEQTDLENIDWSKVDPATNDTIQSFLFNMTPNIDRLKDFDLSKYDEMENAAEKIGPVNPEIFNRNVDRALNQANMGNIEENRRIMEMRARFLLNKALKNRRR